jgi:hypothetical protein
MDALSKKQSSSELSKQEIEGTTRTDKNSTVLYLTDTTLALIVFLVLASSTLLFTGGNIASIILLLLGFCVCWTIKIRLDQADNRIKVLEAKLGITDETLAPSGRAMQLGINAAKAIEKS